MKPIFCKHNISRIICNKHYMFRLGCLTSIFQVLLGVHTGVILMMYKDWKKRVIRWLLWAVFYGCLGCIFHFTNVIPINKSLWY